MPFKDPPEKGYVAPTRRNKKAITIYLDPADHQAITHFAVIEGMTLTDLFSSSVQTLHGRAIRKLKDQMDQI